jgi:drug/metabolite transporter (DMT)-like permease
MLLVLHRTSASTRCDERAGPESTPSRLCTRRRDAERVAPASGVGAGPAVPAERQNGGVTHSPARRPSTVAIVVALLVVYVVWGSTYLAIAAMIESMPPLLSAGARYATAGAVMMGALAAHAAWRGRAEAGERPTAVQWRSAFVVGTLLLLGGNGGVVLAELTIPSGIAAVLVATVPIWLAVLDALLTRRRPSGLVIGGLVAGIVGVAVLLVPVQGIDGLDPLGIGLVVLAAFSWAAGSIYARRAPRPSSGLLWTGMEMVAGGASLLLAGALVGEPSRTDPAAFTIASLAAWGYLVVFGSIVAFTAYSWLLHNVPVSIVGTYAYVNPVVAVALGTVILSEPITPRTLVAAALIIGAVVAMVSGRPRETEEPGPAPEVAPLEADDGAGTDPAAGGRP